MVVDTHNDVFGITVEAAASARLSDGNIIAETGGDDALGIYVGDTGTRMTATLTTVTARGDDDSIGVYLSVADVFLADSYILASGAGSNSTDSHGIYSFGNVTAHNVVAIAENGRLYNYGLQSYFEAALYGGHYEGRGGTGTSNVNAAVGIHSRGTTYAEGVTAIGRNHGSRNQGLDNEGGLTTLVGGYFLGAGGTAAYGIENFGTGGVLTATAVTAIGRDGSSGAYGLYNGGPGTLYGGSFTGAGGGAVFGTYGINNVFSIGTLQAVGVTVVAQGGLGEVWGLRNWLGTVSLTSSAVTAISGTTAYGIDNDSTNASLTLNDVAVLADTGSANSYGLFNRNSADAVIHGGSLTALGGTTVARGLYNQGVGSNIVADGVTISAANGTVNQGLRNQNSAIAKVTNSRLAGDPNNAAFLSSGTVRLGSVQLDGGATRTSGTLTCFQTFDAAFVAYVCP